MQIAARPCAHCREKIHGAPEGAACVSCEVVYHRACAPGSRCPRCDARLLGERELEQRAELADRAYLERGRQVLIRAAVGYAIASFGMSLALFLSRGDEGRFVTGMIRLAIGLAMFRAIGRGSVAVAWIVIVLMSLAALGGVYNALTVATHSIEAQIFAWLFVVSFGGIALRMATSHELWDYIRSQQPRR